MGFDRDQAERGLLSTGNNDIDQAVTWYYKLNDKN